MNEQDSGLLSNYTRVRETPEAILIEAMVIDWPTPSEPVGTWIEAARMPASSDTAKIERARKAVLRNRRYFRRCAECGQRQIKGHMWSNDICMGCAESKHGIIF